jgi:hypothetical protein
LSIDAPAEQERRALAVLALAAGAQLPKELVQAMGDIAQIGECLGLLHRRGLTDEQDDRFGLPVCKVEATGRCCSTICTWPPPCASSGTG